MRRKGTADDILSKIVGSGNCVHCRGATEIKKAANVGLLTWKIEILAPGTCMKVIVIVIINIDVVPLRWKEVINDGLHEVEDINAKGSNDTNHHSTDKLVKNVDAMGCNDANYHSTDELLKDVGSNDANHHVTDELGKEVDAKGRNNTNSHKTDELAKDVDAKGSNHHSTNVVREITDHHGGCC